MAKPGPVTSLTLIVLEAVWVSSTLAPDIGSPALSFTVSSKLSEFLGAKINLKSREELALRIMTVEVAIPNFA